MGAGRDPGGCKHQRWPQRIGKQRARDGDKGPIGLTDREHGEPRGRLAGKPRRKQAGARAGAGEFVQVFRVVEKREVAGAGGIERRDVGNGALKRHAVSRLRPGEGGNLGYRQRFRTLEE